MLSYQVFLEQKKMLKTGLSIAHFRAYVPLIEKETTDYFECWGDSGERGNRVHERVM
jgi:sterol 14-demethylase